MLVVDADTHVDESESTWASLEGTPYEKYIPVTVSLPEDEATRAGFNPTNIRRWVVEGRLQNRAVRDEVNHPFRVRRELEDVKGRLKHMDEMGVDVQVVFPTFFIRYNSNNAEAEWALTSTYNRWLAEKCASTNGRLRWAAVLPLLQPQKAVEELRWAKEHGACGIFKRGFDLDRKITDPHFFPVYEEASALDLPLCIHTGHPLPGHEWDRGFPIMYAFTELVSSKIPKKFPKLRFGFIESGASWIPYVISQLGAKKRVTLRGTLTQLPQLYDLEPDIFRKNRAFVTIDPIDDVESLLKFGTEDNLMIGTDYSHTDISANLSGLNEVRGWVDEGRITSAQAQKILETNSRTFYGL
ncbi:MAG: amidohydrolase family protein [Deltaproteobacteria bacterium]|nr:amidohydrolase family protein [Deltaproteobacteria bacterium]